MGISDFLRRFRGAPAPPTRDEITVGLQVAASVGSMDGVRECLRCGADVNSVSLLGTTALHLAAEKGHRAIVELLLAAGADPRVKDRDGCLAVQCAANKGKHMDCVPVLLAPRLREWAPLPLWEVKMEHGEAFAVTCLFGHFRAEYDKVVFDANDLPLPKHVLLAAFASEIRLAEGAGEPAGRAGREDLKLLRTGSMLVSQFQSIDEDDRASIDELEVFRRVHGPDWLNQLRLSSHQKLGWLWLKVHAKYNRKCLDEFDSLPGFPYDLRPRAGVGD